MNGYLSFLDNKYSIPPEIMIKQIRYVYGYGKGIIGTASISREVYSYRQHIPLKKITTMTAIIFNSFSLMKAVLHQILCQLISKTEGVLLFKNIVLDNGDGETKDGCNKKG